MSNPQGKDRRHALAQADQLLGIQAGLCFFDRSLSSAITKSGALLT
jgi:hypothetical protein